MEAVGLMVSACFTTIFGDEDGDDVQVKKKTTGEMLHEICLKETDQMSPLLVDRLPLWCRL